jgi:hypothetical protein
VEVADFSKLYVATFQKTAVVMAIVTRIIDLILYIGMLSHFVSLQFPSYSSFNGRIIDIDFKLFIGIISHSTDLISKRLIIF